MKAVKAITENNTVEIFKKHLEDFNNDKLDLKALKKDLDNLPFNTDDILKFIKMLKKELIAIQRGED